MAESDSFLVLYSVLSSPFPSYKAAILIYIHEIKMAERDSFLVFLSVLSSTFPSINYKAAIIICMGLTIQKGIASLCSIPYCHPILRLSIH